MLDFPIMTPLTKLTLISILASPLVFAQFDHSTSDLAPVSVPVNVPAIKDKQPSQPRLTSPPQRHGPEFSEPGRGLEFANEGFVPPPPAGGSYGPFAADAAPSQSPNWYPPRGPFNGVSRNYAAPSSGPPFFAQPFLNQAPPNPVFPNQAFQGGPTFEPARVDEIPPPSMDRKRSCSPSLPCFAPIPGTPGYLNDLVRVSGLNPAQSGLLQRAFRKARLQYHALGGQMLRAQDALEDVFAMDSPVPEKVGKAYGKLFDIQRQMIELRVRLSNRVREIRQNKLQDKSRSKPQSKPQEKRMPGSHRPPSHSDSTAPAMRKHAVEQRDDQQSSLQPIYTGGGFSFGDVLELEPVLPVVARRS